MPKPVRSNVRLVTPRTRQDMLRWMFLKRFSAIAKSAFGELQAIAKEHAFVLGRLNEVTSAYLGRPRREVARRYPSEFRFLGRLESARGLRGWHGASTLVVGEPVYKYGLNEPDQRKLQLMLTAPVGDLTRWALRWRCVDSWILESAWQTLMEQQTEPRGGLSFFEALNLTAMYDSDLLLTRKEVPQLAWDPLGETWDEFKRRLKDYRLKVERHYGVRAPSLVRPARKEREHVDWLLQYQANGLSAAAIARTCGTSVSEHTVRSAIKRLAPAIGLRLRAGTRGPCGQRPRSGA